MKKLLASSVTDLKKPAAKSKKNPSARPPRDNIANGENRRFQAKSSDFSKPSRFRQAADYAFVGEDKSERIAKRLARVGIASRRQAETMIIAGRIAVNGKVLTSPAFNVCRTDKITVDGQALPGKERTRLWLYHKPAGLITTARDEQNRPTIFDVLPAELPRVVSVGRLDMNTEGLLLLTNDGGLARILELPSTGWVRHYRVRAHGKISQKQLDALKDGIVVDGVFYGGAEALLEREQGSNVWISIALREGKNREIKNIFSALGLAVTRLIRTSFGPFQLGDLTSGMVREIRGRTLRDQLGEKLAEEAELDFDAPIITPFPNAAVATRSVRALSAADKYSDGRRRIHEENSEKTETDNQEKTGGWIKSGRRKLIPPSEPKPMPRLGVRNANVWHAPGAKAYAGKGRKFAQDRAEFTTGNVSDPNKKRGGRGQGLGAGDNFRRETEENQNDFGGSQPYKRRLFADKRQYAAGDKFPLRKRPPGEREAGGLNQGRARRGPYEPGEERRDRPQRSNYKNFEQKDGRRADRGEDRRFGSKNSAAREERKSAASGDRTYGQQNFREKGANAPRGGRDMQSKRAGGKANAGRSADKSRFGYQGSQSGKSRFKPGPRAKGNFKPRTDRAKPKGA